MNLDAQTVVVMLEREDHTMTGDINKMDDLIHQHWDPVMRKYADQPKPCVARFLEVYKKHIRSYEIPIAPLSRKRLRAQFCKMAEGSAGLDGWGIKELRLVLIVILDMLALLLTKVEQTGRWPTCLARGFIMLVPKGEGAHPLKLRPLSVLSLVY